MSGTFSQSPDSKKEEYRRYLEKSGVTDAITKGLYEETDRPPNAIDYIKKYLGSPANVDVDTLRTENEEMKAKIKELTKQVENLSDKLDVRTRQEKSGKA